LKVLKKNQAKVIETEKLLKEVIKSPIDFIGDEGLKDALKSQAAIADYQNLERNIVSCSLNTVKSRSEDLLTRGFISLDELRKNAKSAIEASLLGVKTSKSNKQSAVGLKKRVGELESQLDKAQRSNFLMTVMISELRSKLKQLAEYKGSVEKRKEIYRYHNKKIEAELNHTLNIGE
tara:strand:- start:452 stop:982 length:531 start_codon:yes stop_codon:yes gene_type:complete